MSEDKSGPAFPQANADYVDHPVHGYIHRAQVGMDAHPGMSLRDYFAAQALAGLIANATYGGELQKVLDHNKEIWDASPAGYGAREYVAEIAYGMADAMIAVRSKS